MNMRNFYQIFQQLQEELEALKARLEKVERERNEFKQTNERLESRVSGIFREILQSLKLGIGVFRIAVSPRAENRISLFAP